MVRGGGVRNGCKRTRRTRQQILLEAEAALLKRTPSSILVNDLSVMSLLATHQTSSLMSSASNGNNENSSAGSNQKKSLRILFQDAKSGKLGRRRRTRIKKNYVWPRTVEAAQSPFSDVTGKNKMFFVLAINLYPESKIIQPSDTESEDEEVNTIPVDGVNDDDADPDEFLDPGSEEVYPHTEEALFGINGSSADVNVFVNAGIDDDDEETYMRERSLSPVSPKVKRGRRANNARRVPYGRAADIDHSWRSNYNRRCVQRRKQTGTRQVRSRIMDPQVIMDVINTVVESYRPQGVNLPSHTLPTNDGSVNVNDNEDIRGKCNRDSDNNNSELSKQIIVPPSPTPPPPMRLEETFMSIKQELVSSAESSDVEVDVLDEEEKIPGEDASYNGDIGDGRNFGPPYRRRSIFNNDVYDANPYFNFNFEDDEDEDDDDFEVVVH